MKHANHTGDDLQTLRGDLEPAVECLDQLAANILARVCLKVVVWTHDDFLILGRPLAIFVFGAIYAGLVPSVLVG